MEEEILDKNWEWIDNFSVGSLKFFYGNNTIA